MIDVEEIKKSGFFQEVKIKKGDYLFHEGDADDFLYIVEKGKIEVEKNTLLDGKTKKLAIIQEWWFIGEGSLCHSRNKEVSIFAQEDTSLLKIDAKNDFPQFVNMYPKESFSILKSIISITNSRLLRANREITANYEITNAINSLQRVDNETIFSLLESFRKILKCDFLFFFEKNTVIENYYTLRYDTRVPWKLQDIIVESERKNISLQDLKKEDISLWKYNSGELLGIGEEIFGYIVISNVEKGFWEEDEKILSSIANSFVGVIRQKELIEEEKNKKYIKNSRKKS